MKALHRMEACLIMALLAFGGFYEWAACFLAALFAVFILLKENGGYFSVNFSIPEVYIPLSCLALSLVSFFSAVDKTQHIYGVLKLTAVILFFFFNSSFTYEQRFKALSIMVEAGVLMTLLGFLSMLCRVAYSFFWQAERFGGFFQYPNTCGIFYVMCIAVWWERRKVKRYKSGAIRIYNRYIAPFALLWGLLATGSRLSMLALMIYILGMLFHMKKYKASVISAIVLLICAISFYFFLKTPSAIYSNSFLRSFAFNPRSSTVVGRILYASDALNFLADKPMGIGFGGYYILQGSFQSGVYTTRFIHNDILQIWMDYGLPMMLLIVGIVAYQLIRGHQPVFFKGVMILLLGTSMLDFHMQYLFMDMIIVLCMDTGRHTTPPMAVAQKKNGSADKKSRYNSFFKPLLFRPELIYSLNRIICTALIPLFLYFGIAGYFSYIQANSLAHAMVPGLLSSNLELLAEETEPEKAMSMAKEINSRNKYVWQAWNVMAYVYGMRGDHENMLVSMENALRLQRYNTALYKGYLDLCRDTAAKADASGDAATASAMENMQERILERKDRTVENSSPLAFKIRDLPFGDWDE